MPPSVPHEPAVGAPQRGVRVGDARRGRCRGADREQ